MTTQPNLDSDLREEILKYLHKVRDEPRPRFPTEYSALTYVALGTLGYLHEAAIQHNKLEEDAAEKVGRPPSYISLHYPGALQEIIELLKSLAPLEEAAPQIYKPYGH